MNMSMEKPTALSSTVGTRSPQVKNAKMRSRNKSPGLGNQNMNMFMDKPIALSSTARTRGPEVKNAKNEFKKKRSPELGN